ncbi:MAG: Hsp20/alpha crystallin family protein [Blastocatellia bacterium]|nr:Hsp20/alpha crystallin family protein [Blastocatellia bacterium]
MEDFAKNTEAVAKRAFELFQKRGYKFGHELEDWFRAERQLFRKVPIDIKDADGNLNIRAEVPGFTADNLKVSVEPNRVTIKGETEEKSEKKDDGTLYSEWKSNKIFRTFDLPNRVNADEATATIKDGVLTLTMPKMIETKPNDVKIETV